jgi:cell division protein FtsB
MVLDLTIIQWIIIALLVWVIALTVLLIQSMLHYRRLTRNITKKDLKTLLSAILNQTNLTAKQVNELESSLKQVRQDMKSHVQKLGFVRFNPFPQTGGDQSFVLALLDEKNNGFVLSSLHSRDITRFYAKTIKNGQGDGYELSREEKQAIAKAK